MVDRVIKVLQEDSTLDSAVTVYSPDSHIYSLKAEVNNLLEPVFENNEIYR